MRRRQARVLRFFVNLGTGSSATQMGLVLTPRLAHTFVQSFFPTCSPSEARVVFGSSFTRCEKIEPKR